jgi:hypothetical protein
MLIEHRTLQTIPSGMAELRGVSAASAPPWSCKANINAQVQRIFIGAAVYPPPPAPQTENPGAPSLKKHCQTRKNP